MTSGLKALSRCNPLLPIVRKDASEARLDSGLRVKFRFAGRSNRSESTDCKNQAARKLARRSGSTNLLDFRFFFQGIRHRGLKVFGVGIPLGPQEQIRLGCQKHGAGKTLDFQNFGDFGFFIKVEIDRDELPLDQSRNPLVSQGFSIQFAAE